MSALVATPLSPADVLTVVVRDAVDTDWAYIEDSWAGSLRNNRYDGGDDDESFRPSDEPPPPRGWYQKIAQRVRELRTRGARFLVACDPSDQNQIIGWACFEKPIIHYVMVKVYFRGQGVARQLIAPLADQKTLWCSAWTRACTQINRTHPNILRKVLPC